MKPILFNTEMVRAILEGQKKVTRRVMKDVPCFLSQDIGGKLYVEDDFGNEYPAEDRCQYKAGDILYVRETWAAWSRVDGIAPTLRYKADGESLPSVKWRPSIHMPKEAARLFLKVTAVRVELLQDITNAGAIDEGMLGYEGWQSDEYKQAVAKAAADQSKPPLGMSPRERFAFLWESITKDPAVYGWDANPWVYVIEFERIEKEALDA